MRTNARIITGLAVDLGLLAVSSNLRSEEVTDQGRVLWAPGAVLEQRHRIEPINRMLTERLETLLDASFPGATEEPEVGLS